jgi:alpha-beta hydrolase superfamily lysophospholipase
MRFYLWIIVLLTGCNGWNTPRCRQITRVTPLPPAHVNVEAAPKWTSFDGSQFPYKAWLTQREKPKAMVILICGWDSTTIDYTILGEHLAKNGYLVYASELRTGVYDPEVRRRGNPKNWRDWVEDLRSFTTFVVKKHPGLPLFYHGHSFGSLVALSAATDAQWRPEIKGVVIQSPALPLLLKKEDLIKTVVLLPFHGLRVPHLQMGPGPQRAPTGSEKLNCRWLSSADRLHAGYKIRYFTIAAELGYHVRKLCGTIRVPVLALAGDQDEVVAPRPGNKEEYRRYLRKELCAGNAEVIAYPDGFHAMVVPKTGDPRLDRTSHKVLTDIAHWLGRRTRVDHRNETVARHRGGRPRGRTTPEFMATTPAAHAIQNGSLGPEKSVGPTPRDLNRRGSHD